MKEIRRNCSMNKEAKKVKRKTLKNKADKLYREIIHSKIYCEVCGSPGKNCHHVIGRSNYNLRWDIQNGCLLCVKCHYQAHNNPVKFLDWFKKKRSTDYNYLLKYKHKLWDKDYTTILQYLNDNHSPI